MGETREADAGSTRVGRASDFILKGGDVRHTRVATEFGRLCLMDCLDAQVCVCGGGGGTPVFGGGGGVGGVVGAGTELGRLLSYGQPRCTDMRS